MNRNFTSELAPLAALILSGVLWPATAHAQARNVVGANQQSSNQTGNFSSTAQQGGNFGSAGQSTLDIGGRSLQSSSGSQPLGTFTQQFGGGIAGMRQGGFLGQGDAGVPFGAPGTQGRGGQTFQQQRNNFSQFGRTRNAGGQGANAERNRGRTNQPQRTIRPRLRIAFDYPQPSVSASTAAVAVRFERLSTRLPGLAGVDFQTADGGRVTLTGTVDSSETRRLAEIMTRMQPGVRNVENQLTVSPAAFTP